MQFKTASSIDQLVWEFKLADFFRGQNRSRINDVFNGVPPFSPAEVAANKIATNVNFLEGAKIAHDARRQFYNAFLNPDPIFTVTLDYGPAYKRQEWSQIITKEINKIIKGSPQYMETRRSVIAMTVLHGIGPSVWRDRHSWRPRAKGVEDVLVPSGTLLDMENLPFLAVYEQYTSPELNEKISGPNVDPGWNIAACKAAIRWVDQEAMRLLGTKWPEVWSPEKMGERIKEDSGLYSSDTVPTIDCFRFFFWNDSGRKSGWSQKVILDAWGEPGVGGAGGIDLSRVPGKYGQDGNSTQFLYDSGNRKFADSLQQIIHWQFADASCVAPFRYHSVRSLGFLLFAVCHLQNRLRCKFNDALFESLMQYFRVNNMPDAERAIHVDLTDKTPLPDGLQFVKPEERWQVNQALVQMGMEMNRQTMSDNSASYTQDFDMGEHQVETATKTMAKANAGAALVGAMLTQAANYQKFEDDEIVRRFCQPNSRDADVRLFRVRCLKRGIPEEALNSTMMDVQPVRVVGGGNKMLQAGMLDKVMTVYYNKLPPSAQKEALRLGIAVTLDDYDLAQRWVPDQPHVSDSVIAAQLAASTLLRGDPMSLQEGVNHSEFVEAMLVSLGQKVQKIMQQGGIAKPEEIAGMQNLAGQSVQGQPIPGNGILPHIQILAQDEKQPNVKGVPADESIKQQVKKYNETLSQLMNGIKLIATNSQKAQQQQQHQNGAGGPDPQAVAKAQTTIMLTKAKIDVGKQSHAQKTAQKQLTFEQKQKQDAEKHAIQMQQDEQSHALELQKQAIETAHNVSLARMKSFQE